MSPDSLQPVLTTKPLVHINSLNKKYILLVIFRHLQLIFLMFRIVVLGFFNLNIKARHEIMIREFLNANL